MREGATPEPRRAHVITRARRGRETQFRDGSLPPFFPTPFMVSGMAGSQGRHRPQILWNSAHPRAPTIAFLFSSDPRGGRGPSGSHTTAFRS